MILWKLHVWEKKLAFQLWLNMLSTNQITGLYDDQYL